MITIEELNQIKENQDLICHYTRCDTALEHILYNMQLRMGPLKNTNDPVEFLNVQMTGFYYGINATDAEDKLSKIENDMNSIFKNQFKVVSFSEDLDVDNYERMGRKVTSHSFNRGFKKARMWSQYADNHRGVCILFSKEKLEKSIKDWGERKYHSDFKYTAEKVEYDNELELFNQARTQLISGNTGNVSIQEIINRKKVGMLFNKLEDYRDEQEFRIAVYSPKLNNEFDYFPISDSIQGIILGDHCPDAYNELFKRKGKEHGFSVFKIKWEHGLPSILESF